MKLCRWCLRQLDDYARFCDKCGMDQLYQLQPPIRYQYYQQARRPQPPPQMVLAPPQPERVIVSPPMPSHAGLLQQVRQPTTDVSYAREALKPGPTRVPETTPRKPLEPEAKILARILASTSSGMTQAQPSVPEVIATRAPVGVTPPTTSLPQGSTAPLGPPGVRAPLQAHVGRPLGVMLLAAYSSILGICAIASASPALSPVENIRQLFTSVGGVVVPDLTYLWILQGFSAIMAFVLSYGLLRRRRAVRLILRVLSALTVVSVVMVVAIAAVLAPSALMQAAAFDIPFIGHALLPAYGGLAITVLIGIALPAAILWYLGRARIKEYFGIPSGAATAKMRLRRRMT